MGKKEKENNVRDYYYLIILYIHKQKLCFYKAMLRKALNVKLLFIE